jgi:EmrB/QacA subfamily drug resistance transporter
MTERDPNETAALISVMLAMFLAPFMISALNVALPVIGRELAANAVVLGWIVTSYILAAAVCLLPFGRLGDTVGRKRIFLWGLGVYTTGSLLSAASFSQWTLISARVVNGIGAAMVMSTGPAILMSVVAPAKRGRALGWNVAAVYAGLSFGPFFGGIITHDLGWRWIFVLNGVGSVLAFAFALARIRGEWAPARENRFDAVGTLLSGLSLMALMTGFTRLPRLPGALWLAVSALVMAAFIRWERRQESPLLDLTLFRGNSVFVFSNLAALINYAATAAVGFLLSLYLQYVKGLSPRQAGLILVAQPVVMTVLSPLAGRLSDRIDAGRIASVGMALTVAGLVGFCFLGAATGTVFIVAGLAVLGLGFALFSSPNTNAVMSAVTTQHYGVASATLGTMRLVGQMLSMAVVMLIISIFMGPQPITSAHRLALIHCIRTAFATFAALCVFGVFASAVRGKVATIAPRV